MRALMETGRKQVILIGIETHICVYQTATELSEMGYEVEVVADAVSSRTPENKKGAPAAERNFDIIVDEHFAARRFNCRAGAATPIAITPLWD